LLPKLDQLKSKNQIKHWELNLIEADEIFFNLDHNENFELATKLSGTCANVNDSSYSDLKSENENIVD